MKKSPLNEATLEARIGSVLNQTFPTYRELKVKHQEYFSLKFGHHNVTVDFREPNERPSRAIYDILLTTADEETNLILLELKNEDSVISDEDIKQGLSYARLIEKIPPITLISNGKEHYFYNTYNYRIIDKDVVDFDFIKDSISKSFKLASQDFKNAVDILMGNQPYFICSIINKLSEDNFSFMKGNISDITKPICDNFLIKRTYVNELHNTRDKKLTALIGHAFSGKTNILYDYYITYRENKEAIFYVDCKEHNYSIFKKLANGFTKTLGYYISDEKIKEWIILTLNNQSELKFTLLLDNYDTQISSGISDEIIELIDIIDSTKHSIVFTIDFVNYQILSKSKYRNYDTYLGSNTNKITIDELSRVEFDSCQKLFKETCQTIFENGAYFAIEYRHPRILRLLAANFQEEAFKLPKEQVIIIPAVPDFDFLKLIASNNAFNSKLLELHEKLAIAFLKDRNNKSPNEWFQLASYHGGITLQSIKEIFGNSTNELLKSGFVNVYELQPKNFIVYPKLSELVSYAGINHIASILLKKSSTLKTTDLCKLFEKLCMPFIGGDNVAVGVLMAISSKNALLFSDMVQHMLNLNPKQHSISNGTRAAILLDERTRVELNFNGDSFDESFIGNYFPHLVLAQIAGYPIEIVNKSEQAEKYFNLYLLHEIGQSPMSYLRIGNFSFKNNPPIISHDIPNLGSVICEEAGVIEPIVHSIQKCLYTIPDEIIRLINYALVSKNLLLLWRFYLATIAEINSTNSKVSKISQSFIYRFEKDFPELLEHLIRKK